ncbi:hypothetical protein [Streptomyces sp. NBC_01751]|uniref:hypothetical protein n=1 Tax=Streptomyces sp. NBC_01751 TaxID=2975929 RepID=UPI002DDB0A47|nr:hypothetical protein [Streptomyces sp. NBC_01751]WSD24573.1 hypothetical protein OHA26_14360 [Streptomyces sp. NBC_01751]
MAKAVSENRELWSRLTDLLNEMENEGISVGVGTEQGEQTGWWALPYLTSLRRGEICVQWSREQGRWLHY